MLWSVYLICLTVCLSPVCFLVAISALELGLLMQIQRQLFNRRQANCESCRRRLPPPVVFLKIIAILRLTRSVLKVNRPPSSGHPALGPVVRPSCTAVLPSRLQRPASDVLPSSRRLLLAGVERFCSDICVDPSDRKVTDVLTRFACCREDSSTLVLCAIYLGEWWPLASKAKQRRHLVLTVPLVPGAAVGVEDASKAHGLLQQG